MKYCNIYRISFVFISLLILILNTIAAGAVEPGVGDGVTPLTDHELLLGSIVPIVTETGKISLSLDGLGTNNYAGGTIQVEKPAGATIRSAYLAAASTGWSEHIIADGDIKIDGVGINWDITTPSTLPSYNHWADITSIVKEKIDTAQAGRINFTITEVSNINIDGEILAVIFDDPSQVSDNTIVFLFGSQDVTGDNFAIALANPMNKSDPDLRLDFSLGISYGYQGQSQYSIVDVNGMRLSTSAGGQDDGEPADGALLTVGGLDDSNTNPPDPNALALFNDYRYDDELYDLLPFVSDGDTSINVFTRNPSVDDNIFFAALDLRSTTAIVGEGIILSPINATNPVGSLHTVTATVQDKDGNPVPGRDVTFDIVSGPNPGKKATVSTDNYGKAVFSYTGTTGGTDVIEAGFVNSKFRTITSNQVTSEWIMINEPPAADAGGPYTVDEGAEITIDGSKSFDPDAGDSIVSYEWDLDNDGTYDAAGVTVPNTWADDYSGTLTLRVTDSFGMNDTAITTVTVNNVAPGVDAGEDLEVTAGDIVSFSGSFTDPGADTHKIKWDFGNGNTSTGLKATNTYEKAGTYTATLTVTDDDGGIGTDTATVTVAPIQADINCNPDSLNLLSNGKWITCYIELSGDTGVQNINGSTVELSYGEVSVGAENDHGYGFVTDESGFITDDDRDGIFERIVKFDRNEVEALFSGPVDPATLLVSGKVFLNGVAADFEGRDKIRVIRESTQGGT